MQKIRLSVFSILFLTGLFIQAAAQTVSSDKALQTAKVFNTLLKNNTVSNSTLRNSDDLQLICTDLEGTQTTRSPQAPSYYLFDRGSEEGFILVAGDERAYPILGYGTTGYCSEETIPDNLKGWLEGYAREIQYAKEQNIPVDENIQTLWNEPENLRASVNNSSRNLLKTADWGQGEPYNRLCVSPHGQLYVTGCTYTASGIIMKYHNYPDYMIEEKFPDQPIPLNWDSMLDNYSLGNYTDEQAHAVAFLLSTLGRLGWARYGNEATYGAIEDMPPVFITNFNYNSNTFYAIRNNLGDDNLWEEKIRVEIDAKRPVLYAGYPLSNEKDGHSFVLDGYQADKFHFNWGWDGNYNGFYKLNAMTPIDGRNYSYRHRMIAQISPLQADTTLASLFLCNKGDNRVGLHTNVSQIQKDQPFIVSTNKITNTAYKEKVRTLCLAHTSVDGVIKEWISKELILQNDPFHATYERDFNCIIKETISPGDRIYLYAKDSIYPNFRIVEGFGASNYIALNDDYYFDISYEECPGVSLIPEEGFSITNHKIGNDFRFKLKTESPDYYGTAIYNGQVLKSDANNIFTISKIRPDISIKLGKELYPTELSLQISAGSLSDAAPQNGLRMLKSLILSGTADFNDFAFLRNNMTELRKIDLSNLQIQNPNNLLPAQAFYGMKQLTHLSLPATLEQIGEYCFFQCPLKQLSIPNTVPPLLLGTNYFIGLENIGAIELVIPENAVEAYKADKDWSRFLIKGTTPTSNQNAIAEATFSIHIEGNNLQIYHPQGKQENLLVINILGEKVIQQTIKGAYTNISIPGRGFYIVRIGTSCRKIFIEGD